MNIITINDDLVYENVEEVTYTCMFGSSGGYVERPPDLLLKIVFNYQPTQLLKYSSMGKIIDELVVKESEYGLTTYKFVKINRIEKEGNRYTMHMVALRMIVTLTEKAKRELRVMELIDKGELFIGFKPKPRQYFLGELIE